MKTIVLSVLVLAVGAAIAQPFHEGKYLLFPYTDPVTTGDSTHDFDVRFYRADLDLPMNSGAMTARVRVELTPRRDDFDTFSLHMVNLVCDSIRRAGNACTFTTPSGRLLVDLDRAFANGESLAVDIYYRRNSGTQNRGFYYHPRGTQGIPHAICYTTTEPSDARYWMPCFDEPWDKAERGCAINVTTPDSMSACSNGLLDSVTTGPTAGTKTYWWKTGYPISTYLMTFAASKWASFKQWFYYTPSESAYIQNFVWPEDSTEAVSSFANTVDMMNYFSDSLIFGRYPFEKYGMVEAYPFPWGGMENQTMTMVHQYWVLYGDDGGIAHELAHMWWGDMVTCLDWRNIWLNEGSGTFSDGLYDYHQNGRASFLSLIASRAQDYFDEEATDPHPIYNPPYPDHLFDWGHSYCKGAWVQHMLRYVEGDTNWAQPGTFFYALRAYGDSFKYGNANTEDYRRIHEQLTGLDLGWFFNEWVYAYGYPIYSLGWQGRQTGDGWEVVLQLTQNNSSGAPAVFHMPVEVKVNWSGGSQTFRYDVAASPQQNVFPVGGQPTSVVFDPNEWILSQHSAHVGVAQWPSSPYSTALRLTGSNPARGTVRLGYELAGTATVRIDIFDGAGRLTMTLLEGQRQAGRYSATWDRKGSDGRTVAAGAYFCRLSAGAETRTVRLVLAD
jgi:aminopeptidase N